VLGEHPRHHDAVDLDRDGVEAGRTSIATVPRPRRGGHPRRDLHPPSAQLALGEIDDERRVGLSRPEVVEGVARELLPEVEMTFTGHPTTGHAHVDRAATRRRRVGRRLRDRRVSASTRSRVAAVGGLGVAVVAGDLGVDAALGGHAGVDGARVVVVAVLVHRFTGAREAVADVVRAGVAVGAIAVLLAPVPLLVRDALAGFTVPAVVVAEVVGVGLAVVAVLLRIQAVAGFAVARVRRARVVVVADHGIVDAAVVGIARVRRARVVVVADERLATLAGAALALVVLRAGVAIVAGVGVDAVDAATRETEVVGAGVVVRAVLLRALAGAGDAGVVVGAGVAVVAVARGGGVLALARVAVVGRAGVVVTAIGRLVALGHHLGDLLRGVGLLRVLVAQVLRARIGVLLDFFGGGVLVAQVLRGVGTRIDGVDVGVAALRVRRVGIGALLRRVGIGRSQALELVTATGRQRDQHHEQARGQLEVLLEHDEGPPVAREETDTAARGFDPPAIRLTNTW